jgi:hypothetical protein
MRIASFYRRSISCIVAAFEKTFQLRDRLEVFRPAGGTFNLDQFVQTQIGQLDTKRFFYFNVRGEPHKIAAGNLAQHINSAERCDEREIQTALDRFDIPPKRQAGRRAAPRKYG